MEYTGRRNRRGRPRSRPSPQHMHFDQQQPTFSCYNSFCSLLVVVSLIAVVYLMLDYHCKICSKKCDTHNIMRSIADIAANITNIEESYAKLEKSIMKFSEDIPKIEGQIGILETLANTMEKGDYVWNPKTHLALPNVDVILKEPHINVSENSRFIQNATEKIAQFLAPVD